MSWCYQGIRIVAMPKMQYLDWTNPTFNEQMYPNTLVLKISRKKTLFKPDTEGCYGILPGYRPPPPFRIEACISPDAGTVWLLWHTVVPSSDYPLLKRLACPRWYSLFCGHLCPIPRCCESIKIQPPWLNQGQFYKLS